MVDHEEDLLSITELRRRIVASKRMIGNFKDAREKREFASLAASYERRAQALQDCGLEHERSLPAASSDADPAAPGEHCPTHNIRHISQSLRRQCV